MPPPAAQPQMGASWPYVQRIFYFHVAAAISAGLCYFLVFIGSVGYLRTRQNRWDHLGHVAAELGVMFSVFVLISGLFGHARFGACSGSGNHAWRR